MNNNLKLNNFINKLFLTEEEKLNPMETEQETSEEPYYEEEKQEDFQSLQQNTTEATEENYVITAIEEQPQQITIEPKTSKLDNQEDRSNFVHGLSVGLGIGCIATFIIWVSVFFTPMLPTTITYEALLSVFICPLIYLLAVGLIALTAGIVREYYTRKGNI